MVLPLPASTMAGSGWGFCPVSFNLIKNPDLSPWVLRMPAQVFQRRSCTPFPFLFSCVFELVCVRCSLCPRMRIALWRFEAGAGNNLPLFFHSVHWNIVSHSHPELPYVVSLHSQFALEISWPHLPWLGLQVACLFHWASLCGIWSSRLDADLSTHPDILLFIFNF